MKNAFKKLYFIRIQHEVCACKELVIVFMFEPVLEIASRKSSFGSSRDWESCNKHGHH